MRITDRMISSNILSNLQLGAARLERLNQQASSGLTLNTPGDDPVSARQVLDLKNLLKDAEQYGRNITVGNAWLEQSDSTMADMGDVVTRARELAVQMANGTYSAAERLNAVNEVNQLKNQLIQLGNNQVGGKYIFGGYVSDKPPFDATTGAFSGTDDQIKMEVDRGAFVPINVSGGQMLRGGTPPGSSGFDIIGALDTMATALAANDATGVRNVLPALIGGQNQILALRGDVGSRLNRVQSAADTNSATTISLNKVISTKQDADFVQVVSDLTRQQTAYQAALSVSAKSTQMSLLDFLK